MKCFEKPARPYKSTSDLPYIWRRYISDLERYAKFQESRAKGFLDAIKLASKMDE